MLTSQLESNNVLHEKSNEDEGRTSHAVAEHGRSFTSKSTKNELDGDATERKLMEATRRDKILGKQSSAAERDVSNESER